MRTPLVILACLVCLLLGGVGGFIIGLGFNVAGLASRTTVERAAISVAAPAAVKVGETFTVVVTVRDLSGTARMIGDVDIEETYLEGAAITGVDPAPSGGGSYAGYAVHTMNLAVAPNGVGVVTFTLRAERPGVLSGDVDVYVDSDLAFETVRISTLVE